MEVTLKMAVAAALQEGYMPLPLQCSDMNKGLFPEFQRRSIGSTCPEFRQPCQWARYPAAPCISCRLNKPSFVMEGSSPALTSTATFVNSSAIRRIEKLFTNQHLEPSFRRLMRWCWLATTTIKATGSRRIPGGTSGVMAVSSRYEAKHAVVTVQVNFGLFLRKAYCH